MSVSRRSDAFAIQHDRTCGAAIVAGDQVRIGPSLLPHFEVLAVHGDNAWVRNMVDGSDHLALTTRCRKIENSALSTAAE
jgi:hypothetical protein